MNAAAPPSCWISATTLAPSFSRRPERTTLAPARANSMAVVLPMPEVPPVTSATLSESFFVFIQFPFAVVEFLKGVLHLHCSTSLQLNRPMWDSHRIMADLLIVWTRRQSE